VGQRGHSKNRGLYFVYRKIKQKSSIANRTSVHHRRKSAANTAEFVSDMMSYVFLRSRWFDIIVLNVCAASEEKRDDSKDSFYEELEQVFDHFHNTTKYPVRRF